MIGIIVAMEIELSALENKMVDISYNEINQIKFIQGRFSNTEIVSCLSGIEKQVSYSVWRFTKQLSS